MIRPVATRRAARTNRDGHLPAPVGGLNTVSPAGAMPPGDARLLVNQLGGTDGLRTRPGYREWVTGLGGDVPTLMPFAGSTPAAGRLFAATSDGVWDCSNSTAAPAKVLDFPVKDSSAGWGVWRAFTTVAGTHFLLLADESNGYCVYSEDSGLWVRVPHGAGGLVGDLDPANVVGIRVWKHRVWLTERGTARAYYTDVDAIYGDTTAGTPTLHAFNFGSQFPSGGSLVGLWSWTQTGGVTIDDALVAISSSGDVAVYLGTDPSSASTFGLKGIWHAGALPAGRQIATEYGGDLLIASALGLTPLSQLTSGRPDSALYPTGKIASLFSALMAERRGLQGWAMRLDPAENALLVLVPQTGATATEQLVQSRPTKGWARYSGLPMLCAEAWDGKIYFGTRDGRVCIHDGDSDGVNLANTGATPIPYSGLTRAENLGSGRQKRVHLIRPILLSQTLAPAIEAEARYAYDVAEIVDAPAAGAPSEGWDASLWDEGMWAADSTTAQPVFGAVGCGSSFAIAWRGVATSRVTLAGFDVVYDVGGVL